MKAPIDCLVAELYDIDGELIGTAIPRYTKIRRHRFAEKATFAVTREFECPYWLVVTFNGYTTNVSRILAYSPESVLPGDTITTTREVTFS